MANSVHKLIIVGNLGRDPEMRYTQSGTPVTSFSVATTRTFKNAAGEKQEETIWFRVTSWGKQAELCNQYLKKGAKVYVEGRLTPDANGNPRIWNKQDGTPGASFEVNAAEVVFLSSNGGASTAEEGQSMGVNEGEEIPF
jgi:single-strand DNA-binding protein